MNVLDSITTITQPPPITALAMDIADSVGLATLSLTLRTELTICTDLTARAARATRTRTTAPRVGGRSNASTTGPLCMLRDAARATTVTCSTRRGTGAAGPPVMQPRIPGITTKTTTVTST